MTQLLGLGMPINRHGKKGATVVTYTPGPHRAWRVRLEGMTGANTALCELQFRASAGGASQTGGTPIASSSFSGSFLPANCFDGNTGSLWAGTGNAGEWVGMDYGVGQTRTVNEVFMQARTDADIRPQLAIVQWSDDLTNWTTDWGVNLVPIFSQGASCVLTRPAQTNGLHYRWRVRTTANQGGTATRFGKVRMRSRSGDTWGQCYAGSAVASSEFSPTFSADKAFGITQSEAWASALTTTGWLAYIFAQPTAVNEIEIVMDSDAAAVGQMPAAFVVESSDDGGNSWNLEWTETGIAAWTANLSRVFTRH